MNLRLIFLKFSAICGARYWMRPCREPRRGGLVKSRAIVSDSQPDHGLMMQMDTAGYQRFSGTRLRQGRRMNSHHMEFPSLPRSRWVSGAGPMTANLAKEKIPVRICVFLQDSGERRPTRLGRNHGVGTVSEMYRWIRFYFCKCRLT